MSSGMSLPLSASWLLHLQIGVVGPSSSKSLRPEGHLSGPLLACVVSPTPTPSDFAQLCRLGDGGGCGMCELRGQPWAFAAGGEGEKEAVKWDSAPGF